FSSRRRHTRFSRDWSSDVCSSDLRLKWPSCRSPANVTRTERFSHRYLIKPGARQQSRHAPRHAPFWRGSQSAGNSLCSKATVTRRGQGAKTGTSRGTMHCRGRIVAIAIATATLFGFGPGYAQESLDQGMTPAQLFPSDCAICHKSSRGLSQGGGLFGLQNFLRAHYTA